MLATVKMMGDVKQKINCVIDHIFYDSDIILCITRLINQPQCKNDIFGRKKKNSMQEILAGTSNSKENESMRIISFETSLFYFIFSFSKLLYIL